MGIVAEKVQAALSAAIRNWITAVYAALAAADDGQVLTADGAGGSDWETPTAGMPLVNPATAGNLVTLATGGTLTDAGYAADPAATPGSVVRRGSSGEGQFAINSPGPSVQSAITATAAGATGRAISLLVDEKAIFIEATQDDAIAIEGWRGSEKRFDIEVDDGVHRFYGLSADDNRDAQRTEIGAAASSDLTAHTSATGAGVHGAGATGAALLATATQDAARSAIGAAVGEPSINSIDANYTLAMTDSGNVVASTAATPIAITVPTNSAVSFNVGTVIVLQQHGAGQVAIAGAPGVTVYSLGNAGATAGQYAASVLRKIGTDNWLLAHDLGNFAPTAITGLKMWFDAGRITGLNDGDTIATWSDASGNGRHATSAAGPTYKANIINGLPVARFNGSNQYLATTTTPSLAQPNTVFVVGKLSNAWTGDGAMFDSTTALGQFFEIYPLDTKAYQMYAGFGVNSATTKTSKAFRIFEVTFAGASSSVIVDGATVVTGNSGSSGIAGLRIGSRGNNSKWLNGDIAEIMVFNANVSSSNRALIRAYLYQKYARGLRLVCDGDSLCYGTGSTGGQSFPVQAAALLGRTAVNVGIPGKNITSVRDETSTLVYGGVQNDVAVFFVGTDDMGSGIDAAVLWPILLTAIQRYIAAGYSKLVVCTLPDSQTPTNPTDYETQRQTFNTYIRSNAAATGYVVADLAADSRIGDVGDANNTNYFDADKVHMNNAGYAIVAEIVVDAINNI